MLSKTKGIVIHSTKTTDSITIITIFTELYGRCSFSVRGLNNKRSATKAAFFLPLSVVEIDMNYNPAKEIHSISDIRIATPIKSIFFNPIKNTIALFISELLFRTIRHTSVDEQLFQFLFRSIEILDATDENTANFHLIFMYKLTQHFGIEPDLSKSDYPYFDLINGEFTNLKPLHAHYIKGDTAVIFVKLSQMNYSDILKPDLTRRERIDILNVFIEYFRLHVNGFNKLNSLEVLQRIFD